MEEKTHLNSMKSLSVSIKFNLPKTNLRLRLIPLPILEDLEGFKCSDNNLCLLPDFYRRKSVHKFTSYLYLEYLKLTDEFDSNFYTK